jgi:hypothetical protein
MGVSLSHRLRFRRDGMGKRGPALNASGSDDATNGGWRAISALASSGEVPLDHPHSNSPLAECPRNSPVYGVVAADQACCPWTSRPAGTTIDAGRCITANGYDVCTANGYLDLRHFARRAFAARGPAGPPTAARQPVLAPVTTNRDRWPAWRRGGSGYRRRRGRADQRHNETSISRGRLGERPDKACRPRAARHALLLRSDDQRDRYAAPAT